MTAQETLAKKEPADVVRSEDQKQYYQPAVDVWETPEEVILQFDMPGVSKNNVDLTVDKGLLTVTGKTDEEDSGRHNRRDGCRRTYRQDSQAGKRKTEKDQDFKR